MEVIRAVYQTGVFIPKGVCVLPEGTEVELTIRTVNLEPSRDTNPDQDAQLLQETENRTPDNPLPPKIHSPLK